MAGLTCCSYLPILKINHLFSRTGFNRTLGLSDDLFALADTALLTVLGQVAFMPLLVLAARICPEVGSGVVRVCEEGCCNMAALSMLDSRQVAKSGSG